MRFTLIYNGKLPPQKGKKGTTKEKWDIRHKIHPQLLELWQKSQTLKDVKVASKIPPVGQAFNMQFSHHDDSYQFREAPNDRDLYEPLEIKGQKFIPLIRKSMALICDLDILFLRKEEPGAIISQGDPDNRIKTLIDGLRMPQCPDEMNNAGNDLPSPMHCLLQDDSLIAGYSIRTERLLSTPESLEEDVMLIIGVTIKVTRVSGYNLSLVSG